MSTHTRMSLIFSAFATFFILAAGVFEVRAAEIEIRDPRNELQGFYFAGGLRPEFSKAFTCNQPLTIFTKTGQCKIHCEFGLCEQTCAMGIPVEAQYNAEECTPEQVTVYSSLGDELTVSKSDYESSANSMARTIIKFINRFYEPVELIVINQAFPAPNKALIENGKITRLFLTTLALNVFPDKTKPESIDLMLTLDLNRSGLDQIMCLTEHGVCEPRQNYLLKRKGLVNATF